MKDNWAMYFASVVNGMSLDYVGAIMNENHARRIANQAAMVADAMMERQMEGEKKRMSKMALDILLVDVSMSTRSMNRLQKFGIVTLGDLCQYTKLELEGSKRFNESSISEIKMLLADRGLRLKREK